MFLLLRRDGPGVRVHYGTVSESRSPSADPVVVFASFRPLPGKVGDLLELLRWMVEHTRTEPGCERYDLFGRTDGDSVHIFERYRDDDALQAHRAADYYVEYRRRVQDLIEGPVEVLVLEAVDAAG
jgi:quinol monooxygenase YgiN